MFQSIQKTSYRQTKIINNKMTRKILLNRKQKRNEKRIRTRLMTPPFSTTASAPTNTKSTFEQTKTKLFRSKETYKKQERVHLFWRPDP
jgi:hypothetical protein